MATNPAPLQLRTPPSYWFSEWQNPSDEQGNIRELKAVGVCSVYLWPPELGGDPEGRVISGMPMIESMVATYLCKRLNVSPVLYKDAADLFLFGLRNPVTGAALIGQARFDVQYQILWSFYAERLRLNMQSSGYNPNMPSEGRGF